MKRNRGVPWDVVLVAIVFVCLTIVWVVNVEVAAKRSLDTAAIVLDRAMPAALYRMIASLSVDMSTVSTFLPMLLTGFVCWALARRRFRPEMDLPWWVPPDQVPFFSGFPSFCFWAGLGGTLYGLVIGLPDGKVALHDALANLILGFKTSIYSTLMGLACAGVSIPVSAIFRRYVFPPEEPPSLADTIDLLRQELGAFRSTLHTTVTPFRQLVELVGSLSSEINDCSARLRTVRRTVNIEWFQQVLQQLANLNAVGNTQFETSSKIHEFLQAACEEAASRNETRDEVQCDQHQAIVSILSELAETLESDRERFGRGLYEMAINLAPSNNGAPRKGATR